MLLKKEAEGVLQVLVAVLEHFIVLGEVVNEIFYEVEVIRIERGQLDVLEVTPTRLCFSVLSVGIELSSLRNSGLDRCGSAVLRLPARFTIKGVLCLAIGVNMGWKSRWAASRVLLENGTVVGATTERPRRVGILLCRGFCPLVTLGLRR